MRIMSKLSAMALVAALASRAGADDTAKTEAKIHIDNASQLHKDGKFQQALDELTIAYSLDPQPGLLYAIGQVHVKLGQCKLAIAFYQRFLATRPDEGPAGAAQEAIATCKQLGDTVPQPDKPVDKPVDPATTAPAAAPVAQPTGPVDNVWYRDTIGDVLVGGGALVAVMGGIVYLSARGKIDDANTAMTYSAQQDLVDNAHSDRVFAIVLAVGGAGLIGAGIYHYMRHAETAPQIGLAPTQGGAFASLALRF